MTQYWRAVCAERCKHGSEGGCRKRAVQHLAGILPYLRHSAATILLGLGVHPKVVQELLGHNQISMTMDIYSHVLPGMQKDAMAKLNDALQEPPEQKGTGNDEFPEGRDERQFG